MESKSNGIGIGVGVGVENGILVIEGVSRIGGWAQG
jgi:hypothetical protein